MISGLYTSAAGTHVQDVARSVYANNLANVNTDGFKRDLALFLLRQPESVEAPFPEWVEDVWDAAGGGTFLAGTFTCFEAGPLRSTGNPLDFALGGKGFFTLSDGKETFYTRNGNFAIDDAGRLVTSDHKYRVLGSGGGSITLDRSRAETISVSPAGFVSQAGTPAGRLAIVDFPDKNNLRKAGGNRFAYTGRAKPASPGAEARATNRFLEGSSANAIKEMVSLIEASRAYEFNIRLIQAQDATLGSAVNNVGRLPA